jgi:hypothetical protein
MQAYRWIEDSRDEFTKERLEALDDSFKVSQSVGPLPLPCPPPPFMATIIEDTALVLAVA